MALKPQKELLWMMGMMMFMVLSFLIFSNSTPQARGSESEASMISEGGCPDQHSSAQGGCITGGRSLRYVKGGN
jgi:hypothetical protein